ncbi:hypothetical protein [Leptospira santarosai]|uniref:Uncharacterized protein n=1 Tax=Leptospira santarosai TaxID=28183 RepID=A0AB73MXD4_9LEPT|nr:hypothetical protein [Leptospira santarosai]AVV52189.1 Uncharacterized protein XB17_03628 [Leptospira santarosai]OLY64307.1 hypothetical protein BWD11_09565 [Leptospira santarosai serovar Grippotyphosa]ONF79914.1 hypothetical protein BWD12_06680 [Leptospira santarosai serovar Bananal]ONF91843.1 hypothetical protein BWD14_15115 [Leptospira santarosai]
MTEYFIYFRERTGFAKVFRIQSRSLLGAKQRASRIFNTEKLSALLISAIEIEHAYSTDPFWVAHKFIGSKKWSSFA